MSSQMSLLARDTLAAEVRHEQGTERCHGPVPIFGVEGDESRRVDHEFPSDPPAIASPVYIRAGILRYRADPLGAG